MHMAPSSCSAKITKHISMRQLLSHKQAEIWVSTGCKSLLFPLRYFHTSARLVGYAVCYAHAEK